MQPGDKRRTIPASRRVFSHSPYDVVSILGLHKLVALSTHRKNTSKHPLAPAKTHERMKEWRPHDPAPALGPALAPATTTPAAQTCCQRFARTRPASVATPIAYTAGASNTAPLAPITNTTPSSATNSKHPAPAPALGPALVPATTTPAAQTRRQRLARIRPASAATPIAYTAGAGASPKSRHPIAGQRTSANTVTLAVFKQRAKNRTATHSPTLAYAT